MHSAMLLTQTTKFALQNFCTVCATWLLCAHGLAISYQVLTSSCLGSNHLFPFYQLKRTISIIIFTPEDITYQVLLSGCALCSLVGV